MVKLLALAVAPGFFLMLYLYHRDRYEREPLGLVVRTFLGGALATLPVLALGRWVTQPAAHMLGIHGMGALLWQAWVEAALAEEAAKLAAVWWLAYRNPNLNEPFDGIVYAAAASLGFATLENLLYVLAGGVATGLVRAVLAVPAHAAFGVTMGYYVGRARFAPAPGRRLALWALALAVPVAMHGLYDVLAMQLEFQVAVSLLLPLVAFFWMRAVGEMAESEASSPFAPGRLRLAGPCPGCGTRLVAGGRYCHQCGRPVAGQAAVQSDLA